MRRFDLTGKAALVTGGNGGIGPGMAKGLEADLRDEKACREMVDEAAKRLGRLDILVNNDTNLTSAFVASHAASDFITGTAIPVDGGYSVQG